VTHTRPTTGRRIEPLGPDEWDDEIQAIRELYEAHPKARELGPRPDPGPMFRVLVRNRPLFRAFIELTTALRHVQKLSDRQRELLVLRTGWRCQAPFAWGQHVRMSLQTGFTHEEIERVIAGPDAAGWTDDERAVLRAADELHDTGSIGDATWTALARFLDDDQLIEVPVVVGWYHVVAFTQTALDIPLEDGAPGLDAR
jgi:alkylhydroperoxidase family enzyme